MFAERGASFAFVGFPAWRARVTPRDLFPPITTRSCHYNYSPAPECECKFNVSANDRFIDGRSALPSAFSNRVPVSHSLNYRTLFNDPVRITRTAATSALLNHAFTRKITRKSRRYSIVLPGRFARAGESLILIDSSKARTCFFSRICYVRDIYRASSLL